MTHAEIIELWIKPDWIGTEIGACDSPIPGLNPIYVDRFAEFAGKPCKVDFWGDACQLPFRSNTLNYVASSHVLEHVANPVAALLEWHRVLMNRGIIYLVVPHRPWTFDHKREPTDPEHMWQDYLNQVTQSDGTHIDEFVDQVDWSMYRPESSTETVSQEQEQLRSELKSDAANGKELNIHFHVFERENFRELIDLVSLRKKFTWKVMGFTHGFTDESPNGILIVIRVNKGILGQAMGKLNQFLARRRRNSVLKKSARRITK